MRGYLNRHIYVLFMVSFHTISNHQPYPAFLDLYIQQFCVLQNMFWSCQRNVSMRRFFDAPRTYSLSVASAETLRSSVEAVASSNEILLPCADQEKNSEGVQL